jgi:hypothetical protein
MTAAKTQAGVGRSEHGRVERQKILDFMHRMGRPVSCREICTAVGQTRVSTVARLGQMRQHREVTAVDGEIGNTPTVFYAPLVRETAAIFSPVADRVKVRETGRGPGPSRPAEARDVTVRRPGYVRHNGMNRDHPLPDQRGQGALGYGGPRGATQLEQMA